MAKIRVHVLLFKDKIGSMPVTDHIHLVLEDLTERTYPDYPSDPYHDYAVINRWEEPSSEDYPLPFWFPGGILEKKDVESASQKLSFDIDADPGVIQRQWIKYHRTTKSSAFILGENCAVAAQRFLTQFANVPPPSASNHSWDLLAFGILWPSFIPCPVTLPGRIMHNAQFHTGSPIFSCTSIDELETVLTENTNLNEPLKAVMRNLIDESKIPGNLIKAKQGLIRLKTLTEFYRQLSDLESQKTLFKQQGKKKEAACAETLLKSLQESARRYVCQPTVVKFSDFKNECQQSIEAAAALEAYHTAKVVLINIALAIVGCGIFYLIAVGINKTRNGDYLFFSKNNLSHDVKDIMKSLSLTKEREEAVRANPLDEAAAAAAAIEVKKKPLTDKPA